MGCSVSKSGRIVVSIRESMNSIAPPATQSSASSVGFQDSQQAERVSSSTPKGHRADSITIVHFNDVYEIKERAKEPVGGAARFKTAVDSVQKLNPLVVFSGDCLNPSACKYKQHKATNDGYNDQSITLSHPSPLLSLSLLSSSSSSHPPPSLSPCSERGD